MMTIIKKLLKKNKTKNSKGDIKENRNEPSCWTLGWSADIELGFGDGTYLSRKAALLLHPEYFDKDGNPILEMLPIDKPKSY